MITLKRESRIVKLIKLFTNRGSFPDSTKNSGVNFWKFPGANGTDFSSVENDKQHSLARLKFFNDFEV